MDKHKQAEALADLTFELLEHCQEKRERMAMELGLTVAEFKLLRVFRNEEPQLILDLAGRVDLSNSRLTRILDGLEKKKFIRRAIGPKDRRTMEVTLTAEGKKTLRQLESTYVATHEDIIKLLPDAEAETVLIAMEKLRNAMLAWVGPDGRKRRK